MLRLAEAIDANVNLVPEFGEVGADLLAQDEVRQVAEAVQEFQSAVDGIVVRNRDQVHSAALGGAIHFEGLRIAVAAAEKAQMLRLTRMPGMDVQIRFEQFCGLPFNHSLLY